MTTEKLIERLKMFKGNAALIMTASEVQLHIDLLEKLKCCGNCDNIRKRHNGILMCHYGHMDTSHDEYCTAWELEK